MQDSEVKDSVSKGSEGFIDDGSESVAVDAVAGEVDNLEEKGTDAPADTVIDDGRKEEPPTEDKGGKEDEDEELPDDKLPKGVLKRLDKMRRKQGDAEREAERLRQENETLKRAQQEKVNIGEKPQPVDYDTEAEYIEALTDWKINKANAERDQKQREREETERAERQKKEAEEQFQETQRKLQDAAKKYKDFADVVYRKEVPITADMVGVIQRFENMADVAYYLGKHEDECADIARSGPADQALSLKDISDKLTAKHKKTTGAPPPINPVTGTGVAIKDMESMSYREYCKLRDKQEKEARGG